MITTVTDFQTENPVLACPPDPLVRPKFPVRPKLPLRPKFSVRLKISVRPEFPVRLELLPHLELLNLNPRPQMCSQYQSHQPYHQLFRQDQLSK